MHLLRGATLTSMPTSRPRHTITETQEVAQALDRAARHWPEDASKRGQLLLHLVQMGSSALEHETDDERLRHQAAVERTAGALTGVYPPGYLKRLRDDWPP
jgi:hypothetical protein